MQRAIESPKKLTEKEIYLMKDRLWTGRTDNEFHVYFDALTALSEILDEYCKGIEERLWRFQRLLYEEREDEAFESVKRKLLENPAWPSKNATGAKSFPIILNALRRRFKELRAQGRGWQHLYPRNEIDNIYGGPTEEERKKGHGRSEGILQNVFLYLDRESAESVLFSWGRVDGMRIWAVDPDYEPSDDTANGYQGYLRVRLQQLVDNFYTARRWHANESSMEDLWRAAQKDPKNGAFISIKDEELFRTEPGIQTHIKYRDFWTPSN
ncbi:hypothetical protein BDV27DRAFT_157272 [Aspergillus caelatus]|uniref:Uncharacterized protein n=1 Tax=Aspergillus caelatus TaxID=61420 RepID=A0A5N7A782_9EURO|nr:uncharacterized protein BDV27DRAFT_157272 [Aspergillus caelatus]KAE8365076.1 hypothetical protein BDV27DRAFT_157272 [Aspergillus caelatus]